MRTRNPVTPLRAVAAGMLAGAVGTACMDTARYLMHRRAGGQESLLAWEFPPVDSWDHAPEPGKAARQLIEGFTQRRLPDSSAWLVSTAAHWAYGSGWGALYGIVAGSLRSQRPLYWLPFGSAVYASDYVVLPVAGIYKPIWEYDAKTLAQDLGGHLAFGAGTGAAFWILVRIL
jgi:hypothetical protein